MYISVLMQSFWIIFFVKTVKKNLLLAGVLQEFNCLRFVRTEDWRIEQTIGLNQVYWRSQT